MSEGTYMFVAGADIRAGERVNLNGVTGMLVPVPYEGRREPAEDQTVIALLCQTLERTGFRTMNGESFEEWARARVRAGDYPEKQEREGQRVTWVEYDETHHWSAAAVGDVVAILARREHDLIEAACKMALEQGVGVRVKRVKSHMAPSPGGDDGYTMRGSIMWAGPDADVPAGEIHEEVVDG